MSRQWNDDERNTCDYISYNKNYENDKSEKSICNIIKEFYKDQEKTHSWDSIKYERDTKRHLREIKVHVPRPPPPAQLASIKIQMNDEGENDDTEFNNDIMDKEIYKKCW
jgi:hypothetical protein